MQGPIRICVLATKHWKLELHHQYSYNSIKSHECLRDKSKILVLKTTNVDEKNQRRPTSVEREPMFVDKKIQYC